MEDMMSDQHDALLLLRALPAGKDLLRGVAPDGAALVADAALEAARALPDTHAADALTPAHRVWDDVRARRGRDGRTTERMLADAHLPSAVGEIAAVIRAFIGGFGLRATLEHQRALIEAQLARLPERRAAAAPTTATAKVPK
jgi:hypothetical protein